MSSDFAEHNPVATSKLGKQAVVVGAGIAGVSAAAALADSFDHVILVERDGPANGEPRHGTPQAHHCHGLLAGGLSALAELFPGIEQDLLRAGSVALRLNQDLREELPDGSVMPQRDFGLTGCSMSRPLLESTLYSRILQRGNLTLRHHTQALGILTDPDGQRVTGIQCVAKPAQAQSEARVETLAADIVVDATGRGQLTATLLQALGRGPIYLSTIGIDLNYTTAIMAAEHDVLQAVLTHNRPPSSRRAVMLPIEGNRWMLSVVGRGPERPPGDWPGVLGHLQQLPTRTLYEVARNAKPLGELTRFGVTQSIWRHFERVEAWPDGLIPIGDAVCRFNPVYGQGMSVAAIQARLLQRMLREAAARPDPIQGLGKALVTAEKPWIETPWTMAAIPDFAVPGTRGERPAGLERSLRFAQSLRRLAARDPEVQRVVVEVWHMLRSRSALDDPRLVQRVEAEMEAMEQAEHAAASAVALRASGLRSSA